MSHEREVDLVVLQKDNNDTQRMIHILKGDETPKYPVNPMNPLFQKLLKRLIRLEIFNSVSNRKMFNNNRLKTHKQIVVSEKCTVDIIRTLHSNPIQGHRGSMKKHCELQKR